MLGIEKEITRKLLKKLGGQEGVKITKELIRTIKAEVDEECNINAERILRKLNRNNREEKPKN